MSVLILNGKPFYFNLKQKEKPMVIKRKVKKIETKDIDKIYICQICGRTCYYITTERLSIPGPICRITHNEWKLVNPSEISFR